MKKTVLRMLAILMLVISTSLWLPCDNAQAQSLSDLATTLTKGGKNVFCGKGSGFYKVTVRSAKGALCRTDIGAAASQLVCAPNVAGFEDSRCDRIGKEKLGSTSPTRVLINNLASATGPVKVLIQAALDIAGVK